VRSHDNAGSEGGGSKGLRKRRPEEEQRGGGDVAGRGAARTEFLTFRGLEQKGEGGRKNPKNTREPEIRRRYFRTRRKQGRNPRRKIRIDRIAKKLRDKD